MNNRVGRKTVINEKLISEVKFLKETENLSVTKIAKITGKSRNTIYKILKKNLHYIPSNRLVKNPNNVENNSIGYKST